jgi:hypothetical protein
MVDAVEGYKVQAMQECRVAQVDESIILHGKTRVILTLPSECVSLSRPVLG